MLLQHAHQAAAQPFTLAARPAAALAGERADAGADSFVVLDQRLEGVHGSTG